jgi:hypothetical protein
MRILDGRERYGPDRAIGDRRSKQQNLHQYKQLLLLSDMIFTTFI